MRFDGEPIGESERTAEIVVSENYVLEDASIIATEPVTIDKEGLVEFNSAFPANKSTITLYVINYDKLLFRNIQELLLAYS